MRVHWLGVALIAALVAIQLVPYGGRHTNPPVTQEPSWDQPRTRALLVTAVREELARRLEHLGHLRAGAHRGVDGARAYVQAMLGLQVWAHGLYQATRPAGHAAGHTHD